MLERALGEKEALDVLLDYAADEGDGSRGDQGQRLNEAMTLHEVSYDTNASWMDKYGSPALVPHPLSYCPAPLCCILSRPLRTMSWRSSCSGCVVAEVARRVLAHYDMVCYFRTILLSLAS